MLKAPPARWSVAGILLLVISIVGRAETLPFKNYTTSDGLAHDRVNQIVRDSRGFLWFCTAEGLSRFDGYQFKNYTRDDGLPNRSINHLLETRDGRYFLATGSGLVLFDPKGQARRWTGNETDVEAWDSSLMFRVYRGAGSEPGKWSLAVNKLLEDRQGNIWCAANGGLYRLEAGDQTQVLRRVDSETWLGGQQEFRDLIEDKSGAIWLAVDGAIHRLLPDGGVQTVVDGLGFVSLYEDTGGNVWAGSGGLNKKGLHQFTYTGLEMPRILQTFTEQDGLASRFWVNGLLETTSATLWAATASGLSERLGRSGPGGPAFRTVWTKAATGLAEDTGGNLWIGTESNGAFRLSPGGFKTFGENDGLRSARIVSIVGGAAGEIFIISSKKTLHQFDGKGFKAVSPAGIVDFGWGWNQVSFQDHLGEWWIAGDYGVGLQRYPRVGRFEDLAHTKAKKIYTSHDGLPENMVFRLFEDSRGDIWIGTLGETTEHLARWDRATDKIVIYSPKDHQIPTSGPTAFAVDRGGNIWIGFYGGGVARFRDGAFKQFAGKDGLPEGFIRDLFTDSQGRIWIATTTSGVVRVDKPELEEPALTNISTAEGLSSNQSTCITEDRSGYIYIGTGRGVNRLDTTTGRIKLYTEADGLAGNYVHVCETDRTGTLWFGSLRGLARFVPEPDAKTASPPIMISDISVNGTRFRKLSELGETSVGGLDLAADQRQIQIDFFALGFGTGETLRYQYKLDNAAWSEPTAQRSVNLNLSPGSYAFAVRALNAEGVVSLEPATVSFAIARPVWQRWWFLLLLALAASGIVYAVYRYRLKRLVELERVRTRIATDLHDDIGSSLSQIAILSEVARARVGDNGAAEPLDVIANTSREMVDSMSDIVWAINPAKDHLSDLVQRMRRFAGDALDARDIGYHFKTDESLRDIALGADIRREVYLIFKECVNNAAKHSAAARVDMAVEVEGGLLVVRVEDDGQGFETDIERRAGAGFGGNGLVNMRRRTEKLGGRFEMVSASGAGTRVAIYIPLAGRPKPAYVDRW